MTCSPLSNPQFVWEHPGFRHPIKAHHRTPGRVVRLCLQRQPLHLVTTTGRNQQLEPVAHTLADTPQRTPGTECHWQYFEIFE